MRQRLILFGLSESLTACGVGLIIRRLPELCALKNLLFAACAIPLIAQALEAKTDNLPNIVVILCDDLGYGDVHCLAPTTCQIETPAADRLAAEGMIFTDAHSGSSVCTPTRYGLLTGRYSWRTRLQQGVVHGFAPNLIAQDRPTVASFLKAQGYHTAIIGKWHLDFQYLDPATRAVLREQDYSLPPIGSIIPDGPLTRGFNTFHGFHHSKHMKAIIEDDRVTLHDPEINMLPRLTQRAVDYIHAQAANPSRPFFLYLPLNSPHTPILPSEQWQGKSSLGKYGDFVMQTDAALGAVLDALDKNDLAENTLVFFTSDNGCSKAAGFPALKAKGHLPSAHMRGSKADLWDGGHRIPFLVRWPGRVAAGSTSGQLICLTDFFATFAEISGQQLPARGAEDSVSFLSALSGQPIQSTRKGVVHHSISGHFGYRTDKWKLLLCRGSGGWTAPNERASKDNPIVAQLYDLEEDPGETDNLYPSRPDIVQRLLKQLESDVTSGRSTAGMVAENDLSNPSIELWKSGQD